MEGDRVEAERGCSKGGWRAREVEAYRLHTKWVLVDQFSAVCILWLIPVDDCNGVDSVSSYWHDQFSIWGRWEEGVGVGVGVGVKVVVVVVVAVAVAAVVVVVGSRWWREGGWTWFRRRRSKRTKEQVQAKNRNKNNTFQWDTPAGGGFPG